MTQYVDQALELHDRPSDTPVTWRIAVYALIERNGAVLMVDQIVSAGPGLTLPGGGVELDREETILEGSVREVYEETGYWFTPDPTSLTVIDDDFIRSPSGRHYHAISFLVRGMVCDAPDPAWQRNAEEIIEVTWLNPKTLASDDVRRMHWKVLVKEGYLTDTQDGPR